MQIGALARLVGVNPKTIRYYEEIGLLPAPRRSESRYRLYSERDAERLRFIQQAKLLGLSLDQIREIISIRERGTKPCSHVLVLLDQKLAEIDTQVRALRELRSDLGRFRAEAAAVVDQEGGVCPVIEHAERFGLAPAEPQGLRRA